MEKPRLEVIRFEEADIITASGRFPGQDPQLWNLYNTSYAEAKEGGASGDYDNSSGPELYGEWQDGPEGGFLSMWGPGFSSDAVGYAWYHDGRWYCTNFYDHDNQIKPDLLSQFTTEYWYPSN